MKINWFPGHMTKALRMMENEIKNIDAVIYVLDARAPLSCFNPSFEKIIERKPVLYIVNKADLCEKNDIDACVKYFTKNNSKAMALNSTLSGNKNSVINNLREICKEKLLRGENKGIKLHLRVMVIGVPNCGKSTLINSLVGSAKTITGNRPGVTKGKQWLSIDSSFDILDTPGTLWSDFENQKVAVNLALIGSIKDDVIDINELAIYLINFLKTNYKNELFARYNLSEDSNDNLQILEQIAINRKFVLKGNEIDYDRTAKMIIDEFRKGKIGKINLEKKRV